MPQAAVLDALIEMIGRINATDEHCAYSVGRPAGDDGWWLVDDLLAVAAAFDALVESVVDGDAAGRRDVAGSYLASRLVGPIVHLLASGWRDDARGIGLELHHVWVRLDRGGMVDGVAVDHADLTVLEGDPIARAAGVVAIGRPEELREFVTGQIATCADRIFDEVRARLPYGRCGMWGALADGVVARALTAEQHNRGRRDPAAAWTDINVLLDHLDRTLPELRSRPRRQLIPWQGGIHHQSVRGTCCLYYKTCEAPAPDGDGYCASCPRRSDESRAERISEWLRQQPARPG